MSSEFPEKDISSLVRLALCVKAFRRLQSELPIQAAHVFLTVATNPGLNTLELMARTRLAQSSCSRNVALLSERHRKGMPGLGLITAQPDPLDGRRNVMFLTDAGQKLADDLAYILRGTGERRVVQRQEITRMRMQRQIVAREMGLLLGMVDALSGHQKTASSSG